MPLRKQLREVLTLIASLDKHNGGVYDAIIYDHFNSLPKENINYSINELLINRLIAEGNTPSGVRFRLFYITDEGLRALSN